MDGEATWVMVFSTRDLLLEEAAIDGARTWAKDWLRSLADEGRLAEGGWPGTLGEARARAWQDASRALAREALDALSGAELDRLTRIVYDEARRVWRAGANR